MRKRSFSLSEGNLCLAGKHSPRDLFLTSSTFTNESFECFTGLKLSILDLAGRLIFDVAYKHLSRSLPTSSYFKLADISSGSARSYVVKNLQPHNQFYFRIRAKNQVGVGLPALLPTQATCVTNSASK